jgi:hypothetical protein
MLHFARDQGLAFDAGPRGGTVPVSVHAPGNIRAASMQG